METDGKSHRGRGAGINPAGRFEKISVELEPDAGLDGETGEFEDRPVRTLYLRDSSRSALTRNDSPDVGFEFSVNPYRGCEHGCSYCYARPTHEYLGFSAGLDFESRIMVKENAPKLLREELASESWSPRVIAMSGVTDCYQPVERKLGITRGCLEVLAEARNPVGIITKNHLVTRDINVLSELARFEAVTVFVSITSLDAGLSGRMEPRASRPEMRLDAIRRLTEAGIPVGVMVAPIVPALTDHEIPLILARAAEAGARFAGYTIVRLPLGVNDVFSDWLERNFPERKERVLSRLRSMRGGKLNVSEFGKRMKGDGAYAAQIRSMFHIARRRSGIGESGPELSTAHFRRPGRHGQMSLL